MKQRSMVLVLVSSFMTMTALADITVTSGNTPKVILEQDATGGFTPYTWDVAGNEANFFIRDVTGGMRLPLRIRPGAPTSSIDIDADGDVGIGTASPTGKLTIKNDTASENVVEIQGSAVGSPVLARVFETAGGAAFFSVFDGGGAEAVRVTAVAGGRIAVGCNSPDHDLDVGNGAGAACSAAGSRSFLDAGSTTFTAASSRSIKENLAPVSVPNILDRIEKVGVYKYDFIRGEKDKIGLMAEDFHTVFERGSDKLLSGQEVEMALWLAVQELTARNKALAEENRALVQRLERIEERLGSKQ